MKGKIMATNNTSIGGGIGICGMLFILFLALKLMGYITWSWWWVIAPLWIPVAITICVLVIIAWYRMLLLKNV